MTQPEDEQLRALRINLAEVTLSDTFQHLLDNYYTKDEIEEAMRRVEKKYFAEKKSTPSPTSQSPAPLGCLTVSNFQTA